jgi:hypothetical protein
VSTVSGVLMSKVVRSDQSRRGFRLMFGAVDDESVTVVSAGVEAVAHGDITGVGEEFRRAGDRTCRRDSFSIHGSGDQVWMVGVT